MIANLFNQMLFKFKIIFNYGSKNVGYVILKTLCILLFVIPFIVSSIISFLIDILFLIPSMLPFIGIVARLVCFIVGSIDSLFFVLLTLSDSIFNSDNMKLIEQLNNSGFLK